MFKGLQKLWACALGFGLAASGCASIVTDIGGQPRSTVPAGQAAAARIQAARTASGVKPAVAYEGGASTGSVRATSGVVASSAEAVKQGASRVSQSLKPPSPPVEKAADPTSVFAKSKPSPELYLQMAKLYEAGGKLPAAEQAYQQGLKSFPKNVELHLAWARLKHRQGQTQEALDLYQKAAKLAPNDASVHNDLGVFYARQGKSKEAIAAYERAIQLQPKKSLYRHNLVMVLVDTGQNDKAMTHLKAVHSEAEACYKLGYLLQKKEQWQQASEYFARAVALNPSMQEAKVWLDHVQARMAAGSSRQVGPVAQLPARAPQPVAPAAEPRVQPAPSPAAPQSPPRASAPASAPKRPSAPERLPAPPANGDDSESGEVFLEDAPLPPSASGDPASSPKEGTGKPARLPPTGEASDAAQSLPAPAAPRP